MYEADCHDYNYSFVKLHISPLNRNIALTEFAVFFYVLFVFPTKVKLIFDILGWEIKIVKVKILHRSVKEDLG